MKTKNKIALNFILAFVVLVSCIGIAAADTPDVKNMSVYIDSALVWDGSCIYNAVSGLWDCSSMQVATLAIERGDEIEVKTVFIAGSSPEKAKVRVWISGADEKIEAETSAFDIYANSTYTKVLALEIPHGLEATEDYTLHVKIEQKKELTGVDVADITTKVQRATNLLEILSVNTYVGSGKSVGTDSALYVNVVVKNRGNYEAEDVYVSAAMAELGLMDTAYLGDLGENDDDDEDTKQAFFLLPLPETAGGSYLLEVKAYNAKVSTSEVKSIVISAGSASTDKGIVITPGTAMNDIGQGAGSVYTLSIANFGSTSQDFVISTEGTDGWATVQITPQTFRLGAGESETVNIYVVASEDAVVAEHVFSAKISYGNTEEQCSFTANVTGEESVTPELKTVLIVIAVILAVVIVVLLIILLTKKETKETEETYY